MKGQRRTLLWAIKKSQDDMFSFWLSIGHRDIQCGSFTALNIMTPPRPFPFGKSRLKLPKHTHTGIIAVEPEIGGIEGFAGLNTPCENFVDIIE